MLFETNVTNKYSYTLCSKEIVTLSQKAILTSRDLKVLIKARESFAFEANYGHSAILKLTKTQHSIESKHRKPIREAYI